jgi:hypothetical protein
LLVGALSGSVSKLQVNRDRPKLIEQSIDRMCGHNHI